MASANGVASVPAKLTAEGTGKANGRVSELDGKAPESTDYANYFCTYAFLYHQVFRLGHPIFYLLQTWQAGLLQRPTKLLAVHLALVTAVPCLTT